MNTTPPPDDRRTLLVNRRFQWSAIAKINLLVLLLMGGVFYFTQQSLHRLERSIEAAHGEGGLLTQVRQEERSLATMVIGMGAAFALALTLGTLVVSHRIAGPMYKMRQHFLRMADEGHLEELEFRETDYFHEVPEAFNAVIARLRREKVHSQG